MKKYYITAFMILSFGYVASGQVKADTNYRLPVNEKLHYKIYYKLGKIWIYAGFANFKTDTLTANNADALKIETEGYSLKKYDWIFSLEDHYTSIINYNSLFPVRFEKENTERGVWVHNIYNFNQDKGTVDMFMETTDKDPVHKTETIPGFITDAISAIYYIRTWDFNNMHNGDTLVFKTILDGKIFDQTIVYEGKDIIYTKDNQQVNAFRLNAVIENSTFFRGDDAVTFWITDNEERWLAKANAKIVVGSIIVYLDKQGLISFGPK